MIERMILEVLDAPKGKRIIIDTDMPTLRGTLTDEMTALKLGIRFKESLYYMIDRTNDCGVTESDRWHISTPCDGYLEISTNEMLLKFIDRIKTTCPDAAIWIESF